MPQGPGQGRQDHRLPDPDALRRDRAELRGHGRRLRGGGPGHRGGGSREPEHPGSDCNKKYCLHVPGQYILLILIN